MVTWRVVATITMFILSYPLTGSVALATAISIVDLFVKSFIYMAHERFWVWLYLNYLMEKEEKLDEIE